MSNYKNSLCQLSLVNTALRLIKSSTNRAEHHVNTVVRFWFIAFTQRLLLNNILNHNDISLFRTIIRRCNIQKNLISRRIEIITFMLHITFLTRNAPTTTSFLPCFHALSIPNKAYKKILPFEDINTQFMS